ncbi:MAG: acyl-CoA thioesterase [Candidatus Cloacimonetes bacterium]|jgi:YbgC/YbaW family acyl-CoA thioester hydrolase|nr:acyl-CoA thioesterase [Candidatus Cloacimonadota bacterium]MBT4333950.1 acyl-CoA thioesterase [Candidatus Cloacimonadota bacterium]MBT4575645.1 acyl-CoA thioesterase [Candidatus Cloacimonadota bacterium]MBT5420610.1 acyl-CoA thioesterase [Candidatus Cloacimonadota bacterium]
MKYNRKIFGYECDIYGHLNNANYLHLYEEARADALEDMDMSIGKLNEEGIRIYISEINLTFKIGLPVGERVVLDTRMVKANRAISVWKQEIFNAAGELCNIAIVKGVFIREGKPFRISKELFEEYKKYIQPE